MTASEHERILEKDPRKVLKRSRMERRRMMVWMCFSVAGVMVAAVLLYLFVWLQPGQPTAPAGMTTSIIKPTASPEQTPIETTEPEPTLKPMVMQDSFKELYAENSDIIGWIKLEGTPINYPVMQTDNNEDYMEQDFYGESHAAGSLFLDFHCDYTNMFEAAHHIIYGHNMTNGSMFQALTQYEDASFFEENRYISLNTLYGNYTFEVFAAYETPISFYYFETEFSSREEWLEFIQVLQEKSMYESDVTLSEDDVVLTLSTCTNSHVDNMRFVVHARLVNGERYDTEYKVIY